MGLPPSGEMNGTEPCTKTDADALSPDDAVHGDPPDGDTGPDGICGQDPSGEPGAGAGGPL